MASFICEGITEAGGTATLFSPSEFSAKNLSEFQAFAFGCPAMGAEVLEESEFEPMFTQLGRSLTGKKIALFGSYGWGDGQWMRDWCAHCDELGASLYDAEGLAVHETPDAAAQESCRALGRALAAW